MSKTQRRKGAQGEVELCKFLEDRLGGVIKRNLGQARDSGHDVDVGHFKIECKRRKRIALLYGAIAQAEASGSDKATPIVALRADGKEWLAVMRLDDWCRLAREELSAP